MTVLTADRPQTAPHAHDLSTRVYGAPRPGGPPPSVFLRGWLRRSAAMHSDLLRTVAAARGRTGA